MKHFLTLLLLLLTVGWVGNSLGQSVNFEDGFEDGDFTNNPTWDGDTNQFTVVDGTPNYLLQLQGDDQNGDVSYLSTPSTDVEGSWEFYIDLDFSPSGNNKATIFLMSDIANLEGAVNGYAVKAGESGTNDVFRIVRYDSGSEAATVLSGSTDISGGGKFRVKVTRQTGGNWTLEVAEGYDGQLSQEGGTQTDNTYSSARHFGVRATYTSTRADLFFFDFKIDLPPFDVTQTSVNGSQVDVTFNRAYDQSTVQASDFSINNGIGAPSSITFPNTTTVRLDYGSTTFPSDRYTVTINDVDDQNGETIAENTTNSFVIYGSFAQGDVIINEFMYDPPSGQAEYVELKNTSSKILNLQDWELGDEGGTDVISFGNLTLEADSFVVISPDTTALFNEYGNRAFVDMSGLASLNNGGDVVQLNTDNGTQADSLRYTPEWGGEDVALERRSATTSATFQENWGNSPNALGGTPGQFNEITADNEAPEFRSLITLSPQTLELGFNERLGDVGSYSITGSSISSVNQTAADSVQLTLGSNLQDAEKYTLTVSNFEDIFGNAAGTVDTTFTFFNPSPVDSGDVAINEIMSAPPSNSSEYVEIYNHSDKTLDLQGWTLSDSGNDEDQITDSQFIVPADSFVVIAPDKSLATNHPDISLLVMNGFPSLNNGGDQVILRDDNGLLLDSLAYDSGWGEDEIAIERRSIDVPGEFQPNWGDAPNGFGTPGRQNEIATDTQSPTLETLEINSNQLTLAFSERLDQSSANNTGNYSLSNGPTIESADFTAPDSVFLQLSSDLQNATTYTLSAQNVSDIFGNRITPIDSSFTFYEVSPVDSGDVFINEFSFEPPAGSTEYIELYNASSNSLDLQSWTLSDNRGNRSVISQSQFLIPPDSFAVIAPDNTLLSDHPDIALVTMGNFPALNNSGDDIVIRDGGGTLLDSLQYTSDWGGDEVALERRTVSTSGIFIENWDNAPNGFGTPGSANQITADTKPPSFTQLFAVDATTLQLIFSENISSASATDKQNYQISPSRDIQLISARDDSLKLFLINPMTSGETYEVTASDISDIFGNVLSSATRETEFLRIDEAQPRDIVINEILYNPGLGEKADFVELYNTSDKNIDLSNWLIGDSSNETDLPQNIQLRADDHIVLTGSNSFASSLDNAIAVNGFPALNNNIPDDVTLRTDEGRTIDSLRYFQSWGGNINGTSLEREDPEAASNDASNWQTSTAEGGSSAGSQNVSFQPDTEPPEIIFSKILGNGNIEVRFNEFIKLTDNVEFLADGQQLQVAKFDSTNANVIILSQPASKNGDNSTSVMARNLSDVKGNITSSSEIAVAQQLETSDLVINEIMFNPLDEPDDNQPDQSEYIELRNTRDFAISLEGLFLHDEPDENDEVRELLPVKTTAKWVPAQGIVLVHADEAPSFDDSNVANFFGLESPNLQSIMRVDRSSLSLASNDDAVYIADSTGATIDSVFYDETWHNPNIIDTRGVSLERIAPEGPSDDDSNWSSSVNEKGGTPNSENSIYQQNAQGPDEVGISFTPNPFSPDDDGREDNLFINYTLDQPDYLVDVQIYDRYGRLVRELADGKQAGLEGQLIWNGRKDDGSRNRIGIYIVVFEAYDSASGSDKSFKKTVVLARKLN